jgi:hypothetical protein
MFNQTILIIITGVNILLLGLVCFNLLRRKHILNFLLGLAVFSLFLLEAGKLTLQLELAASGRLIGLGLCLLPLFWLAASMSLLPSKSHTLSRTVLSPLSAFFSLLFFLIWWIVPFIPVETSLSAPELNKFAQYFFVLLVFSLALSLSNLERSVYYLRQRKVRLLFFSAFFLLVPYILVGTYAVFFSRLNQQYLILTSLSVLIGSSGLVVLSGKRFSTERSSEGAAVQTSLTLFLVGGYLFVVGAFIKLFQVFGWNLNTLFSFITTLFVLAVFLFVLFSSTLKQRIKSLLFRHFTRQKYDWQKIWEEFTYKISLVTDMARIKENIQEAIAGIMGVESVKVFTFEREMPFEEGFCEWLLMKADAFFVDEAFNNGLALKFPRAQSFFKKHSIEMASPLYGEKRIVGLIGFKVKENSFVDKELLKILSLQASGVIINCWANQALREMEKKESMYKVSSFVIHDVKNYINNLSLLIANKDKFDNSEFQKDALLTLSATIEKMQKLMDEFKALRGDITLGLKACSISDIVDEAIEDSGLKRFGDITLTKDVSKDIFIQADPAYMYKVILNLLLNASDAMKGQGTLTVSASVKDSRAVIKVSDTGCGMPEDFINTRLFTPFNSTKPKGLGIGLYQCKAIIEAHGGAIRAESVESRGTTFVVELPLCSVGTSRVSK